MTETATLTDDRARQLLAWLGAGLLAGGMPTHEVEEDVRQAARSLGSARAQVAALPRGIHVALAPGGPATFEQVEGSVRLDQLADVSAVLAGLRAGRLPAEEALDRLGALRARPHRYAVPGLLAGGVLSGVGIALVLAPAGPSVAFAALLAPLTVALMLLGGHRTVATLTPFLAAFGVALAAFAAAAAGWVDAPLWTLVAPIAVILPGATIVTGLVELAAGSMVAGTSRLAHGTVQLLLFALGVGAAVALLRTPVGLLDPERPVELDWWAPLLGVVVVTVAISLMESVSVSLVPWLLVTAVATYLAQLVGNTTAEGRWAGAFLGALVAILVASLVEFVRPELPRSVVFLPSFWLLVPGSFGLVTVAQLEVGPGAAFASFVGVTLVVAAIALGVVLGASLASPLRGAARRMGLVHLLRRVRRRRD
ncbi:threonine/serine exporter family protein [Ornithinimicrobium pekingense]|uniref:threonine/serine exporter family protein n=1 Tax=Ornithinimicrobium pekingense TaxID=384677 RepID=UPI00146D0D25|nr:threonine/serine exporter family protein [Ornithinimicrobium pekingense]